MKKYLLLLAVVTGLASASFAADKAKVNAVPSPASMDPLIVAPDMYKKVFENERVRVMEVTFQPGQKIAPHTHPDHFLYVLSGGKLTISKPDGTSMVADVMPGQVMWINAETHSAVNSGTSVVKLLVNELKEAKPMSK